MDSIHRSGYFILRQVELSFQDRKNLGALSNGINYLLEFFYNWTGNYGIAIILLTLLVRVVLYPLFQKQFTASAQMRKLSPLLAEIQEKYKDNPQEYQQKTMELYQKHKVNPLGGCLPTIIQFPVMISLYNVLMKQITTAEAASFFWIADLSKPDRYILPFLVALTSFGHYRTIVAVDQNPNSKTMLWMLPAFMFFMSFNFPAGLALYWSVFNFLSMAHQYLFNKKWDEKEKQAQEQREAKKLESRKNRKNR